MKDLSFLPCMLRTCLDLCELLEVMRVTVLCNQKNLMQTKKEHGANTEIEKMYNQF